MAATPTEAIWLQPLLLKPSDNCPLTTTLTMTWQLLGEQLSNEFAMIILGGQKVNIIQQCKILTNEPPSSISPYFTLNWNTLIPVKVKTNPGRSKQMNKFNMQCLCTVVLSKELSTPPGFKPIFGIREYSQQKYVRNWEYQTGVLWQFRVQIWGGMWLMHLAAVWICWEDASLHLLLSDLALSKLHQLQLWSMWRVGDGIVG